MAFNTDKYTGSLQDQSNLGGIYRARVEDNVDPLFIGRVRVRVPLLHRMESNGGTPKNLLPWASVCSNNGAGYNYGSFIVPEIGEYVYVMFEDGDKEKPVVIGSVFGTDSTMVKKYGSEETTGVWEGVVGANEVPIESQRSHPSHKMLYKSRQGSMIYVDTDDKTNSLAMEDMNGQKVKLSSVEGKEYALLEGMDNVLVKIHDGKVDIGYEGGKGIQVIPSNGKIVLKASGATITISDDIVMSADNVRISSSSFHVTAGDVTITET